MNIGELISIETLEEKDNPITHKHTPYSAEVRLFSCVQQGDIKMLCEQLKKMNSLVVTGRMSDNELTQYKYMAVSAVTLATRYAIQGGLSEKRAYAFSDRVISRADKMHDKNEILLLLATEIVKLTQEVDKSKNQPDFSPHVRKCIKYINKNTDKKISVSAAAAHCGISADYLSQIFKKELGENLSSYIMRQKTEKAKALLLENVSTKDICAQLGFSSPSYFVTVFKRYTAMTPTEYLRVCQTDKQL